MLGLSFIIGGAAQFMTLTQARLLSEENRDLVHTLATQSRIRAALSTVIIIVSLCEWGFYDALRLGQKPFVVALITFIEIIIFLASSVPYWNRVLAYTRR